MSLTKRNPLKAQSNYSPDAPTVFKYDFHYAPAVRRLLPAHLQPTHPLDNNECRGALNNSKLFTVVPSLLETLFEHLQLDNVAQLSANLMPIVHIDGGVGNGEI